MQCSHSVELDSVLVYWNESVNWDFWQSISLDATATSNDTKLNPRKTFVGSLKSSQAGH